MHVTFQLYTARVLIHEINQKKSKNKQRQALHKYIGNPQNSLRIHKGSLMVWKYTVRTNLGSS